MSQEFFQPELPKKSPRITKEQRRVINGRPFTEIEKSLSKLPYDPIMGKRRQRTIIENSKTKYNKSYFGKTV